MQTSVIRARFHEARKISSLTFKAFLYQMEKINYMSWKETNKDTDSMTFVSVLAIIPFLYFLWVAFFAETMDTDF